jgi:hypothetical protein
MFRSFTQNNEQVFYIPDPTTKRGGTMCRLTRCIHNTMDELEVVKIEKCCNQCDTYDHTYKKCPMNEQPIAAKAGAF